MPGADRRPRSPALRPSARSSRRAADPGFPVPPDRPAGGGGRATGRAGQRQEGQFLAPWDMKNVVAKITGVGNERVLVCERGASFGYNTLVSDMRSLPIMAAPRPGAQWCSTRRIRCSSRAAGHLERAASDEFVPVLARAALAVGVAAVFMEVASGSGQRAVGRPQHGAPRRPAGAARDAAEFDRLAKARPRRFSAARTRFSRIDHGSLARPAANNAIDLFGTLKGVSAMTAGPAIYHTCGCPVRELHW